MQALIASGDVDFASWRKRKAARDEARVNSQLARQSQNNSQLSS